MEGQVLKTRRQMNGHHKRIHEGKKTNEERRLKIILCAPTQKQLERRIQVNLHVVPTVRSLSNVRSALTPPLMQGLCSSTSQHALVRGPTNVDSVRIVAFRRRAWTFTYADITLARHLAVVFAAILPLTNNFSENMLRNITWVQEPH